VLDRGGLVDFFGSHIDVPLQRRFGDIDGVRRYVDAVLGLEAVVVRFPAAPPVAVRERAGQTKAHYESATATIAVPMKSAWAAREAVILHELSHHLMASDGLAGPGADWHGPGYRITMIDLVVAVLGEPAALLLRAGYEEAGVPAGRSR
jgi:putative metallohydrolase (TIGR04338 family)